MSSVSETSTPSETLVTPPTSPAKTSPPSLKRARTEAAETFAKSKQQERIEKAREARRKEREAAKAALAAEIAKLDSTAKYILVTRIDADDLDSCEILVLPDTKEVNEAVDAIEDHVDEDVSEHWETLRSGALVTIDSSAPVTVPPPNVVKVALFADIN